MEKTRALSPKELAELGFDDITTIAQKVGFAARNILSKVGDGVATVIIGGTKLAVGVALGAGLLAGAGCTFKADTSGLSFCDPDPNDPKKCKGETPDAQDIYADAHGDAHVDGSGEISGPDGPDPDADVTDQCAVDQPDIAEDTDTKGIDSTWKDLEALDEAGIIDLDLQPDTGLDAQDAADADTATDAFDTDAEPDSKDILDTWEDLQDLTDGSIIWPDIPHIDWAEDETSDADEVTDADDASDLDSLTDSLADANDAADAADLSDGFETDPIEDTWQELMEILDAAEVPIPSCDDNDPCTDDEYSEALQKCLNTPKPVDDGDPCTNDSCDPATGNPVHTPKPTDDGIPCTEGSCIPDTGEIIQTPDHSMCDDNNECTDDACEVGLGCTYYYNGNPCQYLQDLCALEALCEQGVCQPILWADCEDGFMCSNNSCDPISGECEQTLDHTLCQPEITEQCKTFSCVPENPLADGVGCVEEEKQGQCQAENPCSTSAECQDGQCVTTEEKNCPPQTGLDVTGCKEGLCVITVNCEQIPNAQRTAKVYGTATIWQYKNGIITSAPYTSGEYIFNCSCGDICALGITATGGNSKVEMTPWPYPGDVVYAWHKDLSILGTEGVTLQDIIEEFQDAEINEWIGWGGGPLTADVAYIPELSILFPIDEKDL